MNRVISKKNYIILGFVILGTFLLMYYFYMWYDAYKDTKLNMKILDNYMEVINYNELDDYLVENANAIIYVSVLENSEIRAFEKKFKALFRNRTFDREILYMDVTGFEDVINLILDKYSNGMFKNGDVPMVLVIENGKIKSVYNIVENNYDIDLVKLFISSIKFTEDDELND